MNFKDQTLFGLPPGADFAAALVDGLCAKFAMAPPADLARVQIIVNTQRLARRVSDLFAAKENILHPKLHVLNDLSGLARNLSIHLRGIKNGKLKIIGVTGGPTNGTPKRRFQF